jgi:GT2 family glycosyltransferase
MDVTFLISTFNRRDVLLRTLEQLQHLSKRSGLSTETIVVDNDSTDGTASAIASRFPRVDLVREGCNRGACAKNTGLARAGGEFVVFLDDDSYPDAASVRHMIEHFRADPQLGAAVFDVVLPDGSHECSAYPNVFIGCGTGFRRDALHEVGGLPDDFFMQAEEYDLSLRLLAAGWRVERFEDIRVTHLKTPNARVPARTTRLDVRNNLTLVTRYFPRRWVLPFALDWMRRYRWIAQSKGPGHEAAFWRGLAEGVMRSMRPGHRRPVPAAVFEQFARVDEIERRMRDAVRMHGWQWIVLIDVGKNILPYQLAAEACGVTVVAIADAKLAAPGRTHRGAPVFNDDTAKLLHFDAAVVANASPVHARARAATWRAMTRRPVVDLFEVSPVAHPRA